MKALLVAINAKYIHSNLAVYNLKACSGKYEDNIYIEGISYYLTIKLENFNGNIDIIAE